MSVYLESCVCTGHKSISSFDVIRGGCSRHFLQNSNNIKNSVLVDFLEHFFFVVNWHFVSQLGAYRRHLLNQRVVMRKSTRVSNDITNVKAAQHGSETGMQLYLGVA